MLTSAHTPGPWYIHATEIRDTHDTPVARVGLSANARLIAAAPRMLALLQEYADKARDVMTPAPGSLIERTRAILRDVEGESHGR